MARVEDMLHKMIRRFDDNNEHIKGLRRDLVGIEQKSIHFQYRLTKLSCKWPNYLRL